MILEATEPRIAKGRVNLVCVKCTRMQSFPVYTEAETQIAIAKTGWARVNDRTICPKCPK